MQKNVNYYFQARNNNIGSGRLFVDGPLNPIPGVADLNECSEPEMNDCSENAKCVNQVVKIDHFELNKLDHYELGKLDPLG